MHRSSNSCSGTRVPLLNAFIGWSLLGNEIVGIVLMKAKSDINIGLVVFVILLVVIGSLILANFWLKQPYISPIPDQVAVSAAPVTLKLRVRDRDSAVEELNFFAASSSADTIQTITFHPVSSKEVDMIIVPGTNGPSQCTTTVSVSDGRSTTRRKFMFTRM